MKKRRVSEHPLFSYFAGIFGLLQRFISRDKIRYHGASAFPEGSRLPHGTVPACSKHRTGTARYPLKASFLKISQKFFSRRACPRKTAKSAQQVATDLLDAEMFYKEDCLHGIVHIQSWTAPMEGLCFFSWCRSWILRKREKDTAK